MFKKLWKSNNATQLATLSAKPLNLLVFMPVLLIQLEVWESTLFLLYLSNAVFCNIVVRRIGSIFTRALSIAIGGQASLSEKRRDVVSRNSPNNEPDWKAFWSCFKTLQRMQFFAAGVMILFVAFLNYAATIKIAGSGLSTNLGYLYLLIFLGTLRPYLNSFGFSYIAAQRAAGRVSLNNRIDLLRVLLQNLGGTLSLLMGGGLAGVLIVYVAGEALFRVCVAISVLRLKKNTFQEKAEPSMAIFKDLLGPVLKNLASGMATSVERLSVNLLPIYFSPALVGDYLFTRYLLTTCSQVGQSLWNANFTLWVKFYVQGRWDKIQKSVNRTALLSLSLYFVSVLILLVGYSIAIKYFSFSKGILNGWPLAVLTICSIAEFLVYSSNSVGRIFEYNIDFKPSIIGMLITVPLVGLSLLLGWFVAFVAAVKLPVVIANAFCGFRLYLKKISA
ncbi:hypothetical protein [Roseibacillus persicicus]|uniref:hypothetical protein n=1 Tax=Roseibacillus persicicus TaxID=454148 RepID=UPI001677246A|nr:hypothetical protein [Roseibacillus persicicus]